MGSPVAGLGLSYIIDGLGMVFDAWPSVLTAAQNSFASKLWSCRDQVALADLGIVQAKLAKLRRELLEPSTGAGGGGKGKVMLAMSYRMLACKVE